MLFFFRLTFIKKKRQFKTFKTGIKKKKQNYLVQIQFNGPKLFIYILE